MDSNFNSVIACKAIATHEITSVKNCMFLIVCNLKSKQIITYDLDGISFAYNVQNIFTQYLRYNYDPFFQKLLIFSYTRVSKQTENVLFDKEKRLLWELQQSTNPVLFISHNILSSSNIASYADPILLQQRDENFVQIDSFTWIYKNKKPKSLKEFLPRVFTYISNLGSNKHFPNIIHKSEILDTGQSMTPIKHCTTKPEKDFIDKQCWCDKILTVTQFKNKYDEDIRISVANDKIKQIPTISVNGKMTHMNDYKLCELDISFVIYLSTRCSFWKDILQSNSDIH